MSIWFNPIHPPEPITHAPREQAYATVRRFMLEDRGQFRPLQFEHLRAGDVFCAYEPDGTPVSFQDCTVFRATENAKPDGSIDMVTVR